MLDLIYISFYNICKKRFGKRSILISNLYINSLSLSLLFAAATFLLGFIKQLNIANPSVEKFWTLYTLGAICLVFRNWLYFSGKKRTVINAKYRHKQWPLYGLLTLLAGVLVLGIILYQID